jgi:hypothetical protein
MAVADTRLSHLRSKATNIVEREEFKDLVDIEC